MFHINRKLCSTYIYIYICKDVSEEVQQMTTQTWYNSLHKICTEICILNLPFKLTVPVLISNIFLILSFLFKPIWIRLNVVRLTKYYHVRMRYTTIYQCFQYTGITAAMKVPGTDILDLNLNLYLLQHSHIETCDNRFKVQKHVLYFQSAYALRYAVVWTKLRTRSDNVPER
jgi:hypothetical protein